MYYKKILTNFISLSTSDNPPLLNWRRWQTDKTLNDQKSSILIPSTPSNRWGIQLSWRITWRSNSCRLIDLQSRMRCIEVGILYCILTCV